MKSAWVVRGGRLAAAPEDGAQVVIYTGPDEAERAELAAYGIDDHTLHSTLDPDEPARLERNERFLTLIFKLPRNVSQSGAFRFKVASAGFFLFPEKLLIVGAAPARFFPEELRGAGTSPEHLLLNALLEGIRHFLRHLAAIDSMSESLEEKISVSMENRHLNFLFHLEKSLVYYVSAIEANSVVLEHFQRYAEKLEMTDEDAEILEDVLIENAQCRRQAEIHADILASMMDARVSIVNNNLSMLMKTLNLITIAIMVPTLVVSVFSMNVPLPFIRREGAFWLVLGMSAASLGAVALWWRWLTRRVSRADFVTPVTEPEAPSRHDGIGAECYGANTVDGTKGDDDENSDSLRRHTVIRRRARRT